MTMDASEAVPVRVMTHPELIRRRDELTQVLGVLSQYTMDEVCAELGEISYLLGKG